MSRPLPAPGLSEFDCARLTFLVATVPPDVEETSWQCDSCAAPVCDEDAILAGDDRLVCRECDEGAIPADALRLAGELRGAVR